MPARTHPGRLRPAARALLALAVAAGAAAVGGCGSAGGGGGGDTGTVAAPYPVIVSVEPASLWRDEATTLTLTGTDTGWTPASPPVVLAGSDVVVESVTVTSPTTVELRLRPAYDAAPGLRFVFVSAGSKFVATPEFNVKAPINVTFFSQPFVRGSVLVGAAFASHPDESVDGSVVALASDGSALPLYLDDVHGFMIVVPEDAPLGRFDVLVHHTGPSGPGTARVPAGPIIPRAKVHTTFPASVTLPTADGTALHRYTATSACYLEFPMTSSDPTLPIHFLYPHQSPFAPPVIGLAPTVYGTDLPGPRAIALAGEQFDVVVFAGHTSYGISVVEAPAPLVAETEPNDFPAEAQPLVPPAILHPASMDLADAGGGDDWYRIDVAPADVGKSLRLVSSAGPALSITIFRGDGAVLGGGSASGTGAAVDVRTAPLSTTDSVFLLVASAATPSSPDVTAAYRLFVRLEGP